MASQEGWQVLSSAVVLQTPWLRVRQDAVRTSTGLVMDDYYVVERNDFAMVVALTADNQIILIREYKHAAGRVIVQCPAGYLDEGEDPAQAAQRELLEETGYRAPSCELLGVYFISTGMATVRGHLYLCRDVQLEVARDERKLDEAEAIELLLLDFDAALQAISNGSLTSDMSTVAALLRAAQALRNGA